MGLSPGKLQGVCLSAGQRTDMIIFPKLWDSGDWQGVTYIIADKGYDSGAVRQYIRKDHKYPVIPRRKGAIYPGVQEKDKARYKTRFNIENFFAHIKENKRLALRFDKLDGTFLAFFTLACLKVLKLFC